MRIAPDRGTFTVPAPEPGRIDGPMVRSEGWSLELAAGGGSSGPAAGPAITASFGIRCDSIEALRDDSTGCQFHPVLIPRLRAVGRQQTALDLTGNPEIRELVHQMKSRPEHALARMPGVDAGAANAALRRRHPDFA